MLDAEYGTSKPNRRVCELRKLVVDMTHDMRVPVEWPNEPALAGKA